MDTRCLDHSMTESERNQFEEQGYLIVENALPPDHIAPLAEASDRLIAEKRQAYNLGPHDAIDVPDIIGKDSLFLNLIDWHTTFPKAWGILGWNLCIYHSGLLVTPPGDPNQPAEGASVAWHQDSM